MELSKFRIPAAFLVVLAGYGISLDPPSIPPSVEASETDLDTRIATDEEGANEDADISDTADIPYHVNKTNVPSKTHSLLYDTIATQYFYRTGEGDTLAGIADAFYKIPDRWESVLDDNNLDENPMYAHTKNRLLLPPNVGPRDPLPAGKVMVVYLTDKNKDEYEKTIGMNGLYTHLKEARVAQESEIPNAAVAFR